MAARPISQSLGQVARQRANQIIAPQLAQQTSYGEHQNAVIRAFANSLLGKLQPIAGQVGGDYDAAIKQIGSLSANAAQYVSGQNPAAAQQALGQSVGAPAGQQAQATQALGDTFQGGAGVTAYTGGTIPGSQLASDKAAAMSQARALPAIGALAGQQSLSSALYQQGQERSKLEAQRPGIVQAEEKQIQANNIANARIKQQDKAAKATAVYRQQQLGLGYAKLGQSAADKAADRAATKAYHDSYLAHLTAGDTERVARDKADEAAKAAGLAISQQNADTSAKNAQTSRINAKTSRYRATHPAASTSAPTVHGNRQWDPKTKTWIKAPGLPAASGAKGKTLSPHQLQQETDVINTGVDKAVTGFTDKDGVKHPALNRDEALAEMKKHGYFATPQLARLAMAAINRAYPTAKATAKAQSLFGVPAKGLFAGTP